MVHVVANSTVSSGELRGELLTQPPPCCAAWCCLHCKLFLHTKQLVGGMASQFTCEISPPPRTKSKIPAAAAVILRSCNQVFVERDFPQWKPYKLKQKYDAENFLKREFFVLCYSKNVQLAGILVEFTAVVTGVGKSVESFIKSKSCSC